MHELTLRLSDEEWDALNEERHRRKTTFQAILYEGQAWWMEKGRVDDRPSKSQEVKNIQLSSQQDTSSGTDRDASSERAELKARADELLEWLKLADIAWEATLRTQRGQYYSVRYQLENLVREVIQHLGLRIRTDELPFRFEGLPILIRPPTHPASPLNLEGADSESKQAGDANPGKGRKGRSGGAKTA